jgi:serpin B
MKLRLALSSVLMVVFILGGVPVGAAVDTGLVKGNNAFCFDLYQQLKKQEGNLFFSPYSVSTAMSMTYAGARGKTAKEMAEVMHFTLSQERLHPAFLTLASRMKSIDEGGKAVLSIANALWIQEGRFKLKKTYFKLMERCYGNTPFFVDFIQPEAREKTRIKINGWTADRTREKIKELIPSGMLTDLTRLVITNAVYFKGTWAVQFERSKTSDSPFRVSPGKVVTVPMMYTGGLFRYKDDENIQVLELAYAGEEVSMLVILPRDGYSVRDLERDMGRGSLEDWTEGLSLRDVRVFLPRFKVTGKFAMKETLKAMGMVEAFSDNADFSGMSNTPLQIDEVLHRAFVEVNEEGTEASAATAVIMKKRGRIPMFRADRPFIFLIRDSRTGAVLFMGRVSNPVVW